MSPFRLSVDLAHGGRITTLRDAAGEEWLWRHPSRRVQRLRVGASSSSRFVDAGRIDECLPAGQRLGIEPMIVSHPDLAQADAPGRVGLSGVASWRVRVSTARTSNSLHEGPATSHPYDPTT